MKITDILQDEDLGEVFAVPNDKYPFENMSRDWLSGKFRDEIVGKAPIKTVNGYDVYDLGRNIIVAQQGEPVGLLHLMGSSPYGVGNVFILPEHRNLRLGLAMYLYVIEDRNESFQVTSAQTPYSQRLWCSLWKHPHIDVYAAEFKNNSKRHEVKAVNGRLESDTIDVWTPHVALVAKKKTNESPTEQ